MSKLHLYARSSARGARLTRSHDTYVKNHFVFVVQDIVEVAPSKLFTIIMAIRSCQHLLLKAMKVAICLAAPASRIEPQKQILQKQDKAFETSLNVTRIYNTSELKTVILDSQQKVKRMDT